MNTDYPKRDVEKPKTRTERHAELRHEATQMQRRLGEVHTAIAQLVSGNSYAKDTLVAASQLFDRLVAELK